MVDRGKTIYLFAEERRQVAVRKILGFFKKVES